MIYRTLAAGILLTGSTVAQEVTIGFDHVPAPGAFHQIFPGGPNGPLLEFPEATLDGGVILSDVLFGLGSTTDPNIYATCDTCGLGDGPPATGLPGEISGVFTDCVDSVRLDVMNGFGGSSGLFTLTAFDALGGVVADASVVAGPMGSPGFVQPLSVSGADIASFEVTTNLSDGYTFAIDTLVFEFADLGTPYCTSTPNSTGSAALISARGCRSVSANRLTLSAEPLPLSQFGLFYYGPQAIEIPFGNGFRCVGSPAFRLPVTGVDAGGVMTTEVDLTVPPEPAAEILPGSTWHFQGWYRDPLAGGASFDLSDGLTVSFTP